MVDLYMKPIPQFVQEKLAERNALRERGDFSASDALRDEIAQSGYEVADFPNGETTVTPLVKEKEIQGVKPGIVAVFGSGELSTVGRRIHEQLIAHIPKPVNIALLETPTGFQDNPHHWYRKLKTFLEQGLINFAPDITLVPALRKDSKESTNDPATLAPLLTAHYIHTGAGSPTYTLTHLKDSLALRLLKEQREKGVPLSFASACTIALGKYVIPVYELYFAGHDPYWLPGLDFFSAWGLNLTFVPHWNNREGGADIDTRFAYMGERRFQLLLNLLPGQTTIIGIDEHTALLFDVENQKANVVGKGRVTVRKGDQELVKKSGSTISFTEL